MFTGSHDATLRVWDISGIQDDTAFGRPDAAKATQAAAAKRQATGVTIGGVTTDDDQRHTTKITIDDDDDMEDDDDARKEGDENMNGQGGGHFDDNMGINAHVNIIREKQMMMV